MNRAAMFRWLTATTGVTGHNLGTRPRAARGCRSFQGPYRARSTALESLESRVVLAADITAFPALQFADFDQSGKLDAADIDHLSARLRQGEQDAELDLNRNGVWGADDRRYWVEVISRTFSGDANLDGQFNSGDLIGVFQAGQYEDPLTDNSSWATGDWDGDGDFGTGDLVVAFQNGGFERGPRALRAPTWEIVPDLEGTYLGDRERPLDRVALDGRAEPFAIIRLQETGAVVMADADGRFHFGKLQLGRGENQFTIEVSDIYGHQLDHPVTSRLTAGPGTAELGYMPWMDFSKPQLPPAQLPASLATVYLPVGVRGQDLVEAYVAASGIDPRQGNSRRVELPNHLEVVEQELPGDPPDPTPTAQSLSELGTAADRTRAAVIRGVLGIDNLMVTPEEDDGDVTRATVVDLSEGQAALIQAEIGDGPHGSQGTGNGDFDFYLLNNLKKGQRLTIDVNTPATSALDSWVYVWGYNSNTGAYPKLDVNDDWGFSLDSYLDFKVPSDGDYYVSVAAFGSLAPVIPTDSGSGFGAASEGAYDLILALDLVQDVDVYEFSLAAGDILGATVHGFGTHLTLRDAAGQELIASGDDVTLYHPVDSPLPTGGNASLSWVMDTAGTYTLSVDGGVGPYQVELVTSRPVLESGWRGDQQILFLDFDGATLDAETLFDFGNPNAVLSPLSAFLPDWGLDSADEQAVIDAITATVRENFADVGARGLNGDFESDRIGGHFAIEVVNSRESVDLFGFPVDPFGLPNVSRVVVGGTVEQLGISTIGISQSVDVGNFQTDDTGVVLLDLLSAPATNSSSLNQFGLAEGTSIIDLIGVAVGNIVTHEAGHFFANWHTDQNNTVADLMDQGGNLANTIGIGPDGVFGSGDDVDVRFDRDEFVVNEAFTGMENTMNAISFGLSTGTVDPGMVVLGSTPRDNRQVNIPPAEFVLEFIDEFDTSQPVSPELFTVDGVQADRVSPRGTRELVFAFTDSPVLQPGRQTMQLAAGAVKRSSDGAESARYVAEFGYDPQPLQVVSVSPPDSHVVLPLQRVEVVFNEPYAAESVDLGDLMLSQGRVVGYELTGKTTVEYMLQGVVDEQRLTIVMPDGAVTDRFGNWGSGFSRSYTTDTGRVPLTALQPQAPRGSLVYSQTMRGAIESGDVDAFSIALDPGQTLAVLLQTDDALQGVVEVFVGNRRMARAEASGSGRPVVLQADPVSGKLVGRTTSLAEFSIRVSGVGNSSGRYSLQVQLNAALEEEDYAGPSNDSRGTSIDLEAIFTAPLVSDVLDPSWVSLASAPQRAALSGSLTGQAIAADNFETGKLSADHWTVSSSSTEGRIRVSGQYGAASGDHALLMDVGQAFVRNLNEAIWQVDLTDVPGPVLAFSHASFADEQQAFNGEFQDHFNADGIALSVNGTDWHPIFNAPDTPAGQWQRFHVDLTVATSGSGISLDGPVLIKFQQYDNSPLEDDGRGWDDIVLHRADDADWLSLQLKQRESVSLLGSVGGSGDLKIELFDAQGRHLAEGISPPNPLRNGSFETGDFSYWTVETDGDTDRPWRVTGADEGGSFFFDRTSPQDGQFVAWNGFDGNGPVQFRMFQDVAIPAEIPQALLSWQSRVQWTFFRVDSLPRDFSVELLNPETNELLAELYSFSTGPASSQRLWGDTGWETVSVDLNELGLDLAGQTVRLMFRQDVPDSYTGDAQFELDNIQLDLGLTWPSNVDDLIRDFVAPKSGQYFVRVSGTPLTPYTVVATRNVEFDLEGNNDLASAQALLVPDVQGRQWLLGAVETGPAVGSDFYQLVLEGGQRLSVDTFTPASGDGQFINQLDPLIRLYDASGNLVASDDNSASDGRNAELRYRVPRDAEGTYFMEITGSSSSANRPVGGEYIVSVRGATVPEIALSDVAAATGMQPPTDAESDEGEQLNSSSNEVQPVEQDRVTPLSPAAVDWLAEAADAPDEFDLMVAQLSELLLIGGGETVDDALSMDS